MFAHLLPPGFEHEALEWLKDDAPTFDIGGFVVGETEEIAHLYCKQSCVVAGIPYAKAIFKHLEIKCRWNVEEGTFIDVEKDGDEKKRVIVAVVSGSCRNILLGERTVLNIISRASGVATAARKACQIKEERKWHGYVAGTRKTTPGFKLVEKYALVVGGAATHRMDLSQMVMLKDNHIWSAGSITNAVARARQAAGFSMKIEVECRRLEEALEAGQAGADIIMLDNYTSTTIHDAAKEIKTKFPHILIEASGGITESTMGEFMSPYIDIISRGSLTQGYACMDFSLKIHKHHDVN